MPDVHALLAASDSLRWINCPQSIRATEHIPDLRDEDYSKEGTTAHTLAEILLSNDYGRLSPDEAKTRLDEIKRDPFYNQSMLDYVNQYTSIVHEQYASLVGSRHSFIEFEALLNTSRYIPEGFGTSDVVIYADKAITIIDLKFGKGHEVSAVNNTQLLIYALGAYERLKDKGYTAPMDSTIKMMIVQPRLRNVSESSLSLQALLQWGEWLKEKANAAYSGQGRYQAGEWCKYCPINTTCIVRAESFLDMYTTREPNQMTNEEIGRVLKRGAELKTWVTRVETYAIGAALKGAKIEGFKVIEGKRGERKPKDPENYEQSLRDANLGIDIYKPPQVKGITTLTKELGLETFETWVAPLLNEPSEGSPKLAPLDAKGKEWKPFDPNLFDEFDNNEGD